MIVKKFIPQEFAANNYLAYNDSNETAKEAVLFDCAGSNKEIFKFIDENGLNLKYILITHAHFDHVGGLKEFKEKYPNAKVLMAKADEKLYENLTLQCDMFGHRRVESVKIDEFIDDTKEIEFAGGKIKVISTPGHSAGSVCYLTEDNLFAGDTLFLEEIGRCDLPTGSFKEIEHSIKEKLFKLEDNIKVFTGHGDNTTIGHEKIHNAYFGINSIYS